MNCFNCSAEVSIQDIQCPKCGHVLIDTDEIKESFGLEKEKSELEIRDEKFQLRIATVKFNLYVISGLFLVFIILQLTLFEDKNKANLLLENVTWYNAILSISFLIFARLIEKKPRVIIYLSTIVYSLLLVNNYLKMIPEIFVSFFIPLVNTIIHAGIMMSFIKAIISLETFQQKKDSDLLDG